MPDAADLRPDQMQTFLEADMLVAVSRGKPHEAAGAWMLLQADVLDGTIQYTLTDKGRERLETLLSKMDAQQRAAFLEKGLKAEFLQETANARWPYRSHHLHHTRRRSVVRAGNAGLKAVSNSQHASPYDTGWTLIPNRFVDDLESSLAAWPSGAVNAESNLAPVASSPNPCPDEDDCVSIFRFEVANRGGVTIEQAAEHASHVAAQFPCSIGFRFAGTTVLVAPYDKPKFIVDRWKAAVEAETPIASSFPDHISSSDPCPECSSSRWAPNGDCAACLKRDGQPNGFTVPSREWLLKMAEKEGNGIISAGGWVARVEAAERDDAAHRTAVGGDAQRRHGVLNRLWNAAKAVDQWIAIGVHVPADCGARDCLRNAIEEAEPFAAGLVATQTESERENERLREEVAERDETIGKQQESNENLWRDMNKVRGSNADLRSQLAASQAREAATAETLRGEIAELQQERDLEISRADEMRAEVERRDDTITYLRTQLDAMRTTTGDLLDYFAGLTVQSNYLLNLLDRVGVARRAATTETKP